MKRPLLYIETSVVSYLTSRLSQNTVIAGHQVSTQKFWEILVDKFSPYISDLLLQEAGQGDSKLAKARLDAVDGFLVLDVDEEVESVAKLLLESKSVPKKCPEDAVHIAVAAVNRIELIATWNFKHINNPVMKKIMRETLAKAGYILPEICSPEELLEIDNG